MLLAEMAVTLCRSLLTLPGLGLGTRFQRGAVPVLDQGLELGAVVEVGPHSRYLLAHQDDVTISGWTAEDLAAGIRWEADAR
jgi:hypothetical protein